MADFGKSVPKDDDGKIMAERSYGTVEVSAQAGTVFSDKERDNTTTAKNAKEDEIQLKGQELPEPIRHKDKGMLPCLPYINLSELAIILRDPSMPSQKILNEVADKMMLKSEESESDDGSVSSGGGVIGMKGLLDCIFEVSYLHEDSASSDDDECFETIPREIPCNFCNKIFGSTMLWNTHVLVAHAHQDSSVLNIRRMSANESDRKDKNHPQRKHSRISPKPDCDAKDTKVRHPSSIDRKRMAELPSSENVPIRKRRSSFSRSQQKEMCTGQSENKYQIKIESPSQKQEMAHKSCHLVKGVEDVDRTVCQNETAGSVDHGSSTDQTENSEHSLTGKRFKESLPADRDEEQNWAEKTRGSNQSSQTKQDDTGKEQNYEDVIDNQHTPVKLSSGDISLCENPQSGRKRRMSPLPESTSSLSTSPNSKCCKTNIAMTSVSSSQHKHSDSSPSDTTATVDHQEVKEQAKQPL